MQFKINGDKITITGVDGELDAEQFTHVWTTMQQAHEALRQSMALIRFRDVLIPAGMAWLDEHYPDHVQRVDLDQLDLRYGYRCPLGQASGMHYADAVTGHDLDRSWRAYQLGFILHQPEGVTFAEGTRLWIEAYQARRQGDQKSAS